MTFELCLLYMYMYMGSKVITHNDITPYTEGSLGTRLIYIYMYIYMYMH